MTWNRVVSSPRNGTLCVALLCAFAAVAQAPNPQSAQLPADEVVKKLQLRNQERSQALHELQGTRVYRMEYRGFPSNRDAEMVVHVSYHSPDKKEFTIVSQSG